ncbi:MAG TPA: type IV toxin-antitoxin system AbiEi family antitoxin domain-containing protein [Streptosporangiaceae bacterium]
MMNLPIRCRELIERQRGVLARWQAVDCEVNPSALDALLRRGRWRPLYRGVYFAYSGKPSRASMLWAAVRRCGPDAVLSHQTAAELDGLCDERNGAIHVTIPVGTRIRFSRAEFARDTPRIVVHRSSRIDSVRHPAKSPPRTRVEETVLDLTDGARGFDVAFSWLSAACSRRLVTPEQIREAAMRRKKLRWRRDIIGALEEIADGVLSNLERRFVRDVERPHGLPKPRRQVRMKQGSRSAYLDNLFAEFGVVIELDGLAYHPVEARWQDIHRDNNLATAGIITLRYSWSDVTQRPCQVAAEIALVLRRRGWTGELRPCGSRCVAGSA